MKIKWIAKRILFVFLTRCLEFTFYAYAVALTVMMTIISKTEEIFGDR